MRTLQKNKQSMKYALLDKINPGVLLDEDGNIVYIEVDGVQVPVETGESTLDFSEPVEFFANFSMSSGETEATEFGLNIGDYDAVIVTSVNEFPMTETSLIWKDKAVIYKDMDKTIIDANSADYKVVAVRSTLNQTKYILKKRTESA